MLEDWIRRDAFPFTQLLVEFHARWLGDKRRHTRVLAGLQARGLRIVHEHLDVHTQEIVFVNDGVRRPWMWAKWAVGV